VDTHQSAAVAAAGESGYTNNAANSSVETFEKMDVQNIFVDLGARVILCANRDNLQQH